MFLTLLLTFINLLEWLEQLLPKCKGKCVRWRNLINFIFGVPKYVIANLCVRCNIWYPKDTIVFCPCCRLRVRIKDGEFGWKGKRKNSASEIQRIIKMNVAVGWKPINVKVFEDLQNYIIMENELKNKT